MVSLCNNIVTAPIAIPRSLWPSKLESFVLKPRGSHNCDKKESKTTEMSIICQCSTQQIVVLLMRCICRNLAVLHHCFRNHGTIIVEKGRSKLSYKCLGLGSAVVTRMGYSSTRALWIRQIRILWGQR